VSSRLAAAALLVSGAISVGSVRAEQPEVPRSAVREHVVVRKVVDGDTIDVERDGGHVDRVRLIGIDAPEAHDSPKLDRLVARGQDRDATLALGRQATAFARERLLGRRVELEFDVERRDRFGRLLAYVWLPDGSMFNVTLLEAGQARLLTIAPNVRYVDRFVPLERAAREAGRGLWADPGSARSSGP
jgi:micrococcal nuclease